MRTLSFRTLSAFGAALAMTRFIDSQGLQNVMAPMAISLMVGLGDTRRRAERSLLAAIDARASHISTR